MKILTGFLPKRLISSIAVESSIFSFYISGPRKVFANKLSCCHVQNDSEIFEQMSGSFYTKCACGWVVWSFIIGLHIKAITRETRDPADAGFVVESIEKGGQRTLIARISVLIHLYLLTCWCLWSGTCSAILRRSASWSSCRCPPGPPALPLWLEWWTPPLSCHLVEKGCLGFTWITLIWISLKVFQLCFSESDLNELQIGVIVCLITTF